MTLNIEISDKYCITSDSQQIIVQRKHLVDPTLSPAYDTDKHSSETREEWRNEISAFKREIRCAMGEDD